MTARERTRVGDRLDTCPRCAIISEEVDEAANESANETANDSVTGAGTRLDGLVTDRTNPMNSLIPGRVAGPGGVPVHTAPRGAAGVTSTLDVPLTVPPNTLGIPLEVLGL